MVATVRAPVDQSLLSPSKFQLTFIRIPDVVYFCQRVNIPGVGISEISQPDPFVNIPHAGSKFHYDYLAIEFLIDEQLTSWFGIYDWLKGMAPPRSFKEYRNNKELYRSVGSVYSDATLTVMTDTNNPNIRMLFKDAFPVSLSSIPLDSTQTADAVLTATSYFRFTYYDRLTI